MLQTHAPKPPQRFGEPPDRHQRRDGGGVRGAMALTFDGVQPGRDERDQGERDRPGDEADSLHGVRFFGRSCFQEPHYRARVRKAVPLLLLVLSCATQKSAPSESEPTWRVLYDGKKKTTSTSGNECRMGRDGKQVCGYHCRTGSDGIVKCAATPEGSCRWDGLGRATCTDALFYDEQSDGGLRG